MKYSTPIYLLCKESSAEFVSHVCVKKVESACRREVQSLLHCQACRKDVFGTLVLETDLPHFQGPWAA